MLRVLYLFVKLTLISLIECDMKPFVVGGSLTNISQFPHSAFLSVVCENQDSGIFIPWICGASIVNERILMSAAHCLSSCGSNSHISVTVGHTDREKGTVISVFSYLIHERYNPVKVSHDIALVKTVTPLKYNKNVKRIALMENPPYYEKAQTAGWGFINEIMPKIGKLLKCVDQYVWHSKACKQVISSLPSGTLCASSGESDSYSSRGDSGSALMVRGYIQIGIVSYKMPKVSRSLVVYTDTGYFFDWIKKNSKRLYCV